MTGRECARDMVIPTQGEPTFEDEVIAERVRVVGCCADRVRCATAIKARAGVRTTVHAPGAGIKDVWALKTKPVGDAVVLVDLMIHLNVERLSLLYAHLTKKVIGLSKRGPSDVGRAEETEQLLGNGADAIGADHVQDTIATNLLPARPIRISGCGIINFGRSVPEASTKPRWLWNGEPINNP